MTTRDRNIPLNISIPEPHYQCAGFDTFSAEANGDNHSSRYDEGYRKARELYWVMLIDRESEESCTDFFCEECIVDLGKKTGGKKTLAQVIGEKTQETLDEAVKKMMRMMHAE